jgi:peptidoglycan/xylan/chitin deacetylase (PgdA/CDA1 family)
MKRFFCITVVLAAFGMAACEINPPHEKNIDEYTVAGITVFIDQNWENLGYAARPTKYIALSFDDGPAGAVTNSLLATLEAKKVKATFFLIGQNIRSNKAAAQALFAAGHELANHSDGYSGLGGSTAEDTIRTSLEKASAEINGITGADPVFFRAPNVAYGTNLTKVCTEMGMPIIGVSVWSPP